jgi:hypothetical protein
MAKPIDFPESTCVLAKDQPEYLPLPVHITCTRERITTSCWKLTWRERFKILLTGKVWVGQLTFGQPLQPQLVDIDSPFN